MESSEMAVMPEKVKERKRREEDGSQGTRLERERHERETKSKASSMSKLLEGLEGPAVVDGDRDGHDGKITHRNDSRSPGDERSTLATGKGRGSAS